MTGRWLSILAAMLPSLALAAAVPPSPAPQAEPAQHSQHAMHGHDALGSVHFAIGCTPDAQTAFDQGMVLQHSFAHNDAIEVFRTVVQRDPGCAMGYWGMALATLNNPFLTPPPEGLAEANRLLDQADRIGPKSPREGQYIAALRALVGPCQGDLCTRTFAAATASLATAYPDDPEAQIFYALALLLSAPDDDMTYANQRQAAAILEQQFMLHPDHPGVAHYLIHAYDTPPDAAKGLPAAQRYAQIAHAAPHALHMPSHIFTRLGMWDASIAANVPSAALALKDNEPNDALHAMDYLVYAYLQTARDKAAVAVQVESRAAGAQVDAGHVGGPFAIAAIDARLALEPGNWRAAAALPVNRFDKFPYVEAITHYARALGLARSSQPQAAAPELAALSAIQAKLAADGNAYWAKQVEIQRDAAGAWVAFASDQRAEGLRQIETAAEIEDTTSKNVVMPGPLTPARELEGEMLLEAGQPAQARAAFLKVLTTEPNRFRSTFGAGRAAELAGDSDGARASYTALLRLVANAESDRPELRTARAFLARAQ